MSTISKTTFKQNATLAAVLGLALLLPACTWVEPTKASRSVKLVEPSHVTQCQRLGKTSASVKHRVAGVNRNSAKVKTELETLGRESAAEMGGDSIVALGEPADGRMEFEVYRCNS